MVVKKKKKEKKRKRGDKYGKYAMKESNEKNIDMRDLYTDDPSKSLFSVFELTLIFCNRQNRFD